MRTLATARIALLVAASLALTRVARAQESPAASPTPEPSATPLEAPSPAQAPPAETATPTASPIASGTPAPTPVLATTPTPAPAGATPAPAPTPAATATPTPASGNGDAADLLSPSGPSDPYASIMRVRLSTHPVIVGVKAGPDFPSGRLGMGSGAAIEFREGFAHEGRIGAWLEIGYLATSASGELDAPGLAAPLHYTLRVTEIPVVVGAFDRVSLPLGVWGYGGLGLAAAGVTTVSNASGGAMHEASVALGVDLTAGFERSLGPGILVVEGGYRHLSTQSRTTGPGNLFGPGLRIGFRRAF